MGTKLTYRCNGGYYYSTGSEVRTCQESGLWNGQPAVCQGNEICLVVYTRYYAM